MAVIFIKENKQDVLTKHPYKQFLEKFRELESLDCATIELAMDSEEADERIFYIDLEREYCYEPKLLIDYRTPVQVSEQLKDQTVIRVQYVFRYDYGYSQEYYQARLKEIAYRANYLYIPRTNGLESQVVVEPNAVRISYMAVVDSDRNRIEEISCCLINQIIMMNNYEN